MSWTELQLISISLWVMAIIIMVIGVIAATIFYRKSKTSFSIGIGGLCALWIVGRVFALMVRFDLGLPGIGLFDPDAIYILNLVFWPISTVLFFLGGISLFKEKLKGRKFVTFWVFMVIVAIAVFYIAIFIIESTVGNVPTILPFTGTALLFENLYLVFSWAGFIVLFYTLEINYSAKTRYLFTALSSFSMLFTIYENGTGQGAPILTILFVASMAGLLAIFIFMAVATLGKLRRRSLSLIVGHLCMVFTYLIDAAPGKFVLAFLPEYIFILAPPILIIFGLVLYFIGLLPLLLEWEKRPSSK